LFRSALEYAVSVRQTITGPYADKEVEYRPDGSWVYPYFQENPDPAKRDDEFTNRGLMRCKEDGIPVGVLVQEKPKPGVESIFVAGFFAYLWSLHYLTERGWISNERAKKLGL